MVLCLVVPVCLSNYPAPVFVTTNNHDRFVLEMIHIGKRRMALDEHGRVERDVELAAQVGDALGFMLAAAIGEQDKRDALRLEIRKRLVSSR